MDKTDAILLYSSKFQSELVLITKTARSPFFWRWKYGIPNLYFHFSAFNTGSNTLKK